MGVGGELQGTHLATRGTEGAVRGDSDCVDVAGVTHQVAPELAVGQVPHLYHKHSCLSNIACKQM